jgi:hypothetical protein
MRCARDARRESCRADRSRTAVINRRRRRRREYEHRVVSMRVCDVTRTTSKRNVIESVYEKASDDRCRCVGTSDRIDVVVQQRLHHAALEHLQSTPREHVTKNDTMKRKRD